MNPLLKLVPATVAALLAAAPVMAQENAHSAHHASAPASAQHDAASAASVPGDSAMSEGEVKKVDKGAGKVTIRHGELANLGMPAMTMVFRVKDPAMLEQVKAGDRISFIAEKIGGQLTVVQLRVQQ